MRSWWWWNAESTMNCHSRQTSWCEVGPRKTHVEVRCGFPRFLALFSSRSEGKNAKKCLMFQAKNMIFRWSSRTRILFFTEVRGQKDNKSLWTYVANMQWGQKVLFHHCKEELWPHDNKNLSYAELHSNHVWGQQPQNLPRFRDKHCKNMMYDANLAHFLAKFEKIELVEILVLEWELYMSFPGSWGTLASYASPIPSTPSLQMPPPTTG